MASGRRTSAVLTTSGQATNRMPHPAAKQARALNRAAPTYWGEPTHSSALPESPLWAVRFRGRRRRRASSSSNRSRPSASSTFPPTGRISPQWSRPSCRNRPGRYPTGDTVILAWTARASALPVSGSTPAGMAALSTGQPDPATASIQACRFSGSDPSPADSNRRSQISQPPRSGSSSFVIRKTAACFPDDPRHSAASFASGSKGFAHRNRAR